MTGLLFCILLAFWWWIVYKIVRSLWAHSERGGHAVWWLWPLATVLAALPLADEIIAAGQLKQHCRTLGGFRILTDSQEMRVVERTGEPEYGALQGIVTGGYIVITTYFDARSGDAALQFIRLRSGPGLFARLIGQTQPLLFSGQCPDGPLPRSDLPAGFITK